MYFLLEKYYRLNLDFKGTSVNQTCPFLQVYTRVPKITKTVPVKGLLVKFQVTLHTKMVMSNLIWRFCLSSMNLVSMFLFLSTSRFHSRISCLSEATEKNNCIFHIFRLRFQGNRCKSETITFAWRFTYNNAYNHLTTFF